MSDPLDALRPAAPGPDWQPGVVLERVDRQLFRVQIEGGERTLLCHRAGTVRLTPLKFRAGARVWVVAARNDPRRGRIVAFREQG